jgi:hypothetical protein
MDQGRQDSKAIVDAYVVAKEIKVAGRCTASRHFDPAWLSRSIRRLAL